MICQKFPKKARCLLLRIKIKKITAERCEHFTTQPCLKAGNYRSLQAAKERMERSVRLYQAKKQARIQAAEAAKEVYTPRLNGSLTNYGIFSKFKAKVPILIG